MDCAGAAFRAESIEALRAAYHALFAPGGTLRERADEMARKFDSAEVQELARFIVEGVDRSFCLRALARRYRNERADIRKARVAFLA